jgi:hypothetical protein
MLPSGYVLYSYEYYITSELPKAAGLRVSKRGGGGFRFDANRIILE